MKISYQGRVYEFSSYHRPKGEQERAAIREGRISLDDGTPLEGTAAQRVRDRLLGTYDHLPDRGRRRPGGPRRMLIPGLWPWGTIPVLGGNPKAGKTTFVADLARALVIPGYRFLGCFDPVEGLENNPEPYDPDHDRGRGVVLINAETPAEDMEAAIGLDLEFEHPDGRTGAVSHYLTVEHLEELGGADTFDVTRPELYDLWKHRLAECNSCDGSDDWTPYAVIVDGVTAILGNDTSRYGEWYAAFRRLMREADVPSALAVAHHTMKGDHLMGGVEAQAQADGLWTYSADYADDPRSARRFSVRPRLGGVVILPSVVTLNPEGRPVMHKPGQAAAVPVASPSEASAASPFEAAVLAALDPEGGWTPVARLDEAAAGKGSGNPSRDRRAMVDRGVIEYNAQRGPQSAYRLPRGDRPRRTRDEIQG